MASDPKPKKLTIKQKKFVKAYVANDGNGQKAALETYDINKENMDKALNTANVIAVENLQKPTVKEAIESALVKHGITMEAAVKPIADGLNAFSYKTSDMKEGNRETEAIPDHNVRLKASGMALKLMGAENRTIEPTGNTFIQVNNNMKNEYDD